MAKPTNLPASEMVSVSRDLLAKIASELESPGYTPRLSYADCLRSALAATQLEPPELSYEEICEILGHGHVKWIESQKDPIDWAENYARDEVPDGCRQTQAYRALARFLREREHRQRRDQVDFFRRAADRLEAELARLHEVQIDPKKMP